MVHFYTFVILATYLIHGKYLHLSYISYLCLIHGSFLHFSYILGTYI